MISTALSKHETSLSQRSTDGSSTSSSDDDSVLQQQIEQTPEKLKRKTQNNPHYKRKPHKGVNSIDKYQMEISLALLLSLGAADCFELTAPYVNKFLHLQSKYPGTNYYDIDINDVYFIFTGILIATFVRAFTMNYILRPFAWSMGINSHKAIQRFMEQGWCVVYYSTSFCFGMYIYHDSPYFLNCDNFFIGWPHDRMTWLFKAYYLTELAGWLQQIFTLNIEARRKDHWQMFSHHIITCLLVTGSYYYYFTRIGNVIMAIMDIVDILLSTAKLLKYCGFHDICDAMFGIFVVAWIVLRHGVYNYMLYHTVYYSKSLMLAGKCVEGLVQKRCWTDNVMTTFVYLLAGLQVIMCIWMYLIGKVVIKVVTGTGAEDVRSDDEDTDNEIEGE